MEPRCAIGVHESGPHHALYPEPDADRRARLAWRGVRRQAAGLPADQRRHRRRLRHEDRRSRPRTRSSCYAARKLGRPVKWRAERSEEFLAAHMARDQHYRRRARARPRRTHPRAAHGDARQHRRGAGRLLGDDPARDGGEGRDFGLPRAGGRLPHQGDADQHHGDRRLPRRGAAGRQLPDRAADREGRARDAHRPRRAAPAQPSQARRAPAQDARRRDLRQRRVRAHARRERSRPRTGTVFEKRRHESQNAGKAARAGPRGATWNGPARYPPRPWTSRSTPTGR